jgi:undecaprenyl-diphosphatase
MFWQNVHQLDQQITLTINSWNSAFTDPIWTFLSLKLVWAPLYAAIIALMIWKLGWKKGLIVVGGVLLTIGFCDQFVNLIKHATARIRPVNDEWMVAHGLNILEWGGGFSFFSAHAANSFGIAGSSWFGLKNCLIGSQNTCRCRLSNENLCKYYAWIMFTWASLVAISRIFVGKHYLGDVIVGTIVGILGGIFFGWLASRIANKYCAPPAK